MKFIKSTHYSAIRYDVQTEDGIVGRIHTDPTWFGRRTFVARRYADDQVAVFSTRKAAAAWITER